ncbi:MAG: RnfH family protein [Gammaproteobacteria bacterium]
MAEILHVEVVYALRDDVSCVSLTLASGSTLGQAIEASGLLQKFTGIDLDRNRVGIFGKLYPLDHVLSDGDRVEIYRPLLVDPKESRRRRAAKKAKHEKSSRTAKQSHSPSQS